MGRAILPVAPDVLAEMFGTKGHGPYFAIDAPADMRIVDAYWDSARQWVCFVMESPELPDTKPGGHLLHRPIALCDFGPGKCEMLMVARQLRELAESLWPEGACSSPTEKGE